MESNSEIIKIREEVQSIKEAIKMKSFWASFFGVIIGAAISILVVCLQNHFEDQRMNKIKLQTAFSELNYNFHQFYFADYSEQMQKIYLKQYNSYLECYPNYPLNEKIAFAQKLAYQYYEQRLEMEAKIFQNISTLNLILNEDINDSLIMVSVNYNSSLLTDYEKLPCDSAVKVDVNKLLLLFGKDLNEKVETPNYKFLSEIKNRIKKF